MKEQVLWGVDFSIDQMEIKFLHEWNRDNSKKNENLENVIKLNIEECNINQEKLQ